MYFSNYISRIYSKPTSITYYSSVNEQKGERKPTNHLSQFQMMFGLRIEVHCVKAFPISRETSRKKKIYLVWYVWNVTSMPPQLSTQIVSNYTNKHDINGDFQIFNRLHSDGVIVLCFASFTMFIYTKKQNESKNFVKFKPILNLGAYFHWFNYSFEILLSNVCLVSFS